MRWRDARRSENVEDRRGMSVGRAGAGIGGAGLLLLLLLSWLSGQNPLELLQQVGPVPDAAEVGPGGAAAPGAAGNDEAGDFVRAVLGDTEDAWVRIFSAAGRRYVEPRLVLFSDAVQSACGFGSAAAGPFYCPGDSKLYLDLAFFEELNRRFGAPGDFAAAYVIAHEVGHHVQHLLGIEGQVDRLRRQGSEADANALSVRLELQADCFAGVWGHHASRRDLLEVGDVEEGLRAAAAVGDDRIQRQARGYVVPESFTHGSSAQRVEWLKRGLQSGDWQSCDTFQGALR
jgi:uncharacterized protein